MASSTNTADIQQQQTAAGKESRQTQSRDRLSSEFLFHDYINHPKELINQP